ncbi:MAG: peptidoglycan-binding protein [Peptococcaceae bacterium]|nr:peptidoglycan-binding protein [Peptococcaceae bacterium]
MKKKILGLALLVVLMTSTAVPLSAHEVSDGVHFHLYKKNKSTVYIYVYGSAYNFDQRVSQIKYGPNYYTQGSYVCLLQDLLRECKKRNIGKYPGGIDGYFGNITKQGVIDYQRARGLYPDGIVGPDTWKALEKDYRIEMKSPYLWTFDYPNNWGW